jgi:superfamily I DNA and/or RNA helicase/predicted DNA-binding WGR domain protein
METINFKQFLQGAFENGEYTNDDVIAFVLPLFKEVLALHEEGCVAPFDQEGALFISNNHLDTDSTKAHNPKDAHSKLQSLFKSRKASYFDIVGSVKVDTDLDEGKTSIENTAIHTDLTQPLLAPAYIPGYKCFELLLGHHDDQTDIFCLGLVLGSMALSLDLYDTEDLKVFAGMRSTPGLYNNRIHPTISTLITEMTELDRHKRSQDLYDVIQRLENYRDFDPEKQVDLTSIAGWKQKEISDKGQFILTKLRNRLFDTSRRNRLLYYKPNMRFVNLTVSSVPMVLHYQSIRPELLFTWNSEISEKVRGMKEIVLNKYLRFDDHTYLKSSLDRIRVEAQHDIQEYGFSQLKLVIAFINWHNLKETPNERIQSPLLLIPAELKKNKKLKEDHYMLRILDNEAEVNPIVANQLRELYGIRLPDFIDLDDITLEAFFQKIKEQIDHANQGIAIHYIDKPKIKLIHTVARQTVNNYKRKLRRSGQGADSYRNIAYSYQAENYKPLGLEIFRQKIEPRASTLEYLVNEDIKVSSNYLTGAKERQMYELVESENNPYSWDFDVCNIVLGNFNYKKMSLVRDYNQVIDHKIHHKVFEHLFSDQPKKYSEQSYDLNDPATWHHVVTADPTQTKAILQSRSGESYIIQGPPGTGKSQTITNLIADYAARGKSVLFVCEKRAALDVVFHRLKQQGLDELCCYIHDSQGDKREFIRNLKETYEDFIKNKLDHKKIRDERDYLLQKIENGLSLIRDYHQISTWESENASMEVRKLVERIIEIKHHLVNLSMAEEELLPYYKEWKTFGDTIRQLSQVLEETGAEPGFSEHPFSKVREEVFLSERPAQTIQNLLEQARQHLQQINSLFHTLDIDPSMYRHFSQVKNLVEDAVMLQPLAINNHTKLVDPKNAEAIAFEKAYRSLKSLEQELKNAKQKNEGWKARFSEGDVDTALPLAQSNEGSFFSFFNGGWRKLKKQLNDSYDFSIHQVRPSYVSVLEALKKEYTLETDVRHMQRQLETQYGLQHLEAAYIGIERTRGKLDDPEVDLLLHHPDPDNLVRKLYTLNNTVRDLDAALKQLLFNHEQKSLEAINDELDNIEANVESLPELLPVLRQYARLSDEMKKALRQLSLPPKSVEATMANKTLKQVYQHNKTYHNADGPSIEQAVAQIQSCFAQLLKLNAAHIRAKVRERFLNHVDLSNMALSQLNAEQKVFKKNYSEGRRILENEFGKSMRYKSIRDLAAKESGLVLKDLKPVWLMSPLSVSDSLPVDAVYFDVVIFDEASQITLEEGIPSLYRAPQTIIVGDDKQMPPTNFFSARSEDPDDLDKFQTEEGDEVLGNDADSLLVQGSRKLSSVMLGWHYRSRYETLISYSNHAFYGAGLLTIPDRNIHHAEKPDIEVTGPDDAQKNVSALFDRSISYHFLPASVYEKRVNADEAAYIAQLVRELLKSGTEDSIGIVAFSQEQQHTIEDALTRLATEDKVFEQQLEEAYNRTEYDQFVGLFVKNLENVQGDERDIIIMSVCYGFDARKRMIMNFGPINKKGGEKRLNVIFSRAKKHMAVVSSIKHQNITNEYNEGAGYFKRFLNYAEQVSRGNMEMARLILDGLVLRKQVEEEEEAGDGMVLRQLKEALSREGFDVSENIGQSDFKCNLAIRLQPQDNTYTLSIMLDDNTHYGNTNLLEQYYQRPAVLRAFGWKTIAVFAKDWLHHPQAVISNIRKRITEQPVVEEVEITPGILGYAPVAFDTSVNEENPGARASSLYGALAYRRFQFTEGSSNKFWEAAVDEQNRLVVRFGRLGTKGQTQIKSFGSREAAEAEKEKMIREKVSKGYLEAG